MCPVKKGIEEEEDRGKSYDSNDNFDMEEQVMIILTWRSKRMIDNG